MWHLTACKNPLSLLFLNWVKKMKWFYCIPELMLATLIQRFDKKNRFIFYPVQERQTNWNVTGYQVPYFMIIRYNRLNLSWIIKCQFVRTMEPLMQTVTPRSVVSDLVLQCLLMSLLWDAKYKWVNGYLGIYMPRYSISYETPCASPLSVWRLHHESMPI